MVSLLRNLGYCIGEEKDLPISHFIYRKCMHLAEMQDENYSLQETQICAFTIVIHIFNYFTILPIRYCFRKPQNVETGSAQNCS